MTTHSNETMTPAELEVLLQRYLDGDLPGPEATRLFLAAEKDSVLAAELEAYRTLFRQLDELPREEPSEGFDQAVLAPLPYERYASAPRRVLPVLVFGKELPSPLSRFMRSLGRGGVALMAAYLLFLVVSRSALAQAASSLAHETSLALNSLAESARELPVLSGLVGSLAWAYDAGVASVAALGRAWGEDVVTLVLGLVFGALVLAAVQASRRRQEAPRTHA